MKPGWVVSHSGGPGIVVDHGNVETLDPGFVNRGGAELRTPGGLARGERGDEPGL